MSALSAFEKLAKQRRANLRIDAERPVDHDLLNELIELATWAPNHHHTWPWRFAVLEGDARGELAATAAGRASFWASVATG